mmetsp:Transcript_941/g.2807  ORF Transcript_941/g.2807 Transcript_941/m.2807 type:complete len:254 (-) Transcript_941:913-1674(-)
MFFFFLCIVRSENGHVLLVLLLKGELSAVDELLQGGRLIVREAEDALQGAELVVVLGVLVEVRVDVHELLLVLPRYGLLRDGLGAGYDVVHRRGELRRVALPQEGNRLHKEQPELTLDRSIDKPLGRLLVEAKLVRDGHENFLSVEDALAVGKHLLDLLLIEGLPRFLLHHRVDVDPGRLHFSQLGHREQPLRVQRLQVSNNILVHKTLDDAVGNRVVQPKLGLEVLERLLLLLRQGGSRDHLLRLVLERLLG